LEKKRKLRFKPKQRLDFTCYRYRWHLYYLDRYLNDKEVILASTKKLRDIKEYILEELSNWDCFSIEVRLRLYALCKQKGTGKVFKIPYDIFCDDEEEKS
jgi:hypothetical protein